MSDGHVGELWEIPAVIARNVRSNREVRFFILLFVLYWTFVKTRPCTLIPLIWLRLPIGFRRKEQSKRPKIKMVGIGYSPLVHHPSSLAPICEHRPILLVSIPTLHPLWPRQPRKKPLQSRLLPTSISETLCS